MLELKSVFSSEYCIEETTNTKAKTLISNRLDSPTGFVAFVNIQIGGTCNMFIISSDRNQKMQCLSIIKSVPNRPLIHKATYLSLRMTSTRLSSQIYRSIEHKSLAYTCNMAKWEHCGKAQK